MPNNKMLIDASHPEETRVVVIRGNRLEEFDFESSAKKPLRGNIYLAKVTRVEPSLQAAFVDYDGNRNGFLAFTEIHPDYYQIPVADRQALLEEEAFAARREREREDYDEQRRRGRRRDGARTHSGAALAEDNGSGASGDERLRSRDGLNADLSTDGSRDDSLPHALEDEAQGETGETGAGLDRARHLAEQEPILGARHNEPHDFPMDGHNGSPHTGTNPDGGGQHEGGQPAFDFAAGENGVNAPPKALQAIAQKTAAHSTRFAAQDAVVHGDFSLDAEAYGHESAPSLPFVEGAAPKGIHEDRRHADEDANGELDETHLTQDREPLERSRSHEPTAYGASAYAAARGGMDETLVEQIGGDSFEELPRRQPVLRRRYKIQEVIKRRQILLVQVVKEERGNKGAALTTYLSLAGRYCVLMPNTARGGGISRKITDGEDRDRLRAIVSELDVPDGMGVILRTAGAARSREEIRRDFEYLLRMWEQVRETTLNSVAPSLVYEEGTLIKRSIRDLYNKDIDEIIVAGEEAYREARDYMAMLMPGSEACVRLWREPDSLYTRTGVEAQLDALFSNRVTLKSGGYLIINQTEALVAIDVNSGRSTREHNIEDTAVRTNLEAVEEVARQLRLRDLAGLIVIDFIDMEEGRNNRLIERRMKDALRFDRARIQIGRISPFGLMEISRQRMRTGVLESSTNVCPHCQGSGSVRSTASIALYVLRGVEDYLMRQSSHHHLIVRAHGAVALYILNQKRTSLSALEERFELSVTVLSDESLDPHEHYRLERGELALPRPILDVALREPDRDNGINGMAVQETLEASYRPTAERGEYSGQDENIPEGSVRDDARDEDGEDTDEPDAIRLEANAQSDVDGEQGGFRRTKRRRRRGGRSGQDRNSQERNGQERGGQERGGQERGSAQRGYEPRSEFPEQAMAAMDATDAHGQASHEGADSLLDTPQPSDEGLARVAALKPKLAKFQSFAFADGTPDGSSQSFSGPQTDTAQEPSASFEPSPRQNHDAPFRRGGRRLFRTGRRRERTSYAGDNDANPRSGEDAWAQAAADGTPAAPASVLTQDTQNRREMEGGPAAVQPAANITPHDGALHDTTARNAVTANAIREPEEAPSAAPSDASAPRIEPAEHKAPSQPKTTGQSASLAADEAPKHKRTGWWQRAKATLTGENL